MFENDPEVPIGVPHRQQHQPKAAQSSAAFDVMFGRRIPLTLSVVGRRIGKIAFLVCSGLDCRGPESAMQQRNIYHGLGLSARDLHVLETSRQRGTVGRCYDAAYQCRIWVIPGT